MKKQKEEIKNNLSPFKQMLREDIDIFLTIEEMGETINIEGNEYIGVIEHLEKDFSEIADMDIYTSIDIIIYLKEEDFSLKRRNAGKKLKVNNTSYIVNDWYVEEGMTIIKLKEVTAY